MRIGRRKKKEKIVLTNAKAEIGVINYPSIDLFIDALIKFEFKSIDEMHNKRKEIKEKIYQFYLDNSLFSIHMEPIVIISELTGCAISYTKKNALKIDISMYLRKGINNIEELDLSLFEKLIEEISK